MQVLIGDLGELGRRAVACKHWRWMPGMLDLHGNRFLGHDGLGDWWIQEGEGEAMIDYIRDSDTPKLSDPATLGCLLHLVRMSCGNMQVCSYSENHVNWGVFVDAGIYLNWLSEDCASEAEALVAALEAV